MIPSSAWKCLLLPLIALAGLGAQNPRQAVKFTGRSIPDPPSQKDPWTPPETKLPRFLVAATAALFEQGMANPRGCEYREVEIVEGWTFKTRAFVLPERPGDTGRYALSWDGVIHPASSVGPAADLDADIRALADSMRRALEDDAAGKAGGRKWPAGFLEPYLARAHVRTGRTRGRRGSIRAQALHPAPTRPGRPGGSGGGSGAIVPCLRLHRLADLGDRGGAPVRAVLDEGEARRGGRSVCNVSEDLRRSVHGQAPSGEHVRPNEKRAHLAFPILDRPATKDDVRAARAIFSLEGEGEIRRIELPSIPIKARWIPPGKAPADSAEDGWVWQAEEVRKGGQWERYYGFVGRHVIARVPASSIELAGGRRPALGDR